MKEGLTLDIIRVRSKADVDKTARYVALELQKHEKADLQAVGALAIAKMCFVIGKLKQISGDTPFQRTEVVTSHEGGEYSVVTCHLAKRADLL